MAGEKDLPEEAGLVDADTLEGTFSREPDIHLHPARGRHERAARRTAREHLVERDAESEDVGAMIRIAGMLLRRHVVRRAHGDIGHGESAGVVLLWRPREPKVGELYTAVAREKDVLGLDIAMDDPLLVRGLQGFADLPDQFQCLVGVQAGLFHDAAEVGAIDELHHEKEVAFACLAEVIDRHDAGVVEPGQRAGLALESDHELLVGRQLGRQEFDGNRPVQFGLKPFVNRPHSAVSQQALDVILREQPGQFLRRGRHPAVRSPGSPGSVADPRSLAGIAALRNFSG